MDSSKELDVSEVCCNDFPLFQPTLILLAFRQKKELHGSTTSVTNNESVQVIVRSRPMSASEINARCTNVVTVYPERGVIEVQNPKARSENEKYKMFTYDGVYDSR